MGKGFGGLYKLYGIVTYRVSPMHLKAFHGVFTHGFPNTVRRFAEQVPYVLPPFLLGYGIFAGCDHLHHQYLLKKPGDFDDEEEDCEDEE